MAETSDAQGILYQNLMDAGCGEALAGQILRLMAAGEKQEGLALLAGHRRRLLECCHAEQKKIDCLDFLVYHMEKSKEMDAQWIEGGD